MEYSIDLTVDENLPLAQSAHYYYFLAMNKRRISLPLLIIISAGAALLLSSCNTFIGMGRDFQRLGTGFENTGYGRKF